MAEKGASIHQLEQKLDDAKARVAELEGELRSARAEREELRSSEARFRILSELISDCCWARFKSADGDTERLWVNDAFENLTGYAPHELDTLGREALIHPDDLDSALQYVDGPLGVSEHEFRIVRKDGVTRWLREKMSVTQEEDGSLLILGATQDISRQKKAEEVLHHAHRVMEQRVDLRTAELQEAKEELEAEVADHRSTQRELRAARDQAEAASRTKSQFLARMSHEMRTPLNGILGMAELLLGTRPPQENAQRLQILQTSAQQLLGLIDNVLDFSQQDSARLRDAFQELQALEWAPPPTPRQSRRILVVEDSPVNQIIIGQQIENLGHTADIVDNGRKALDALEKTEYGLVLMDCRMPVLDGYETTRLIRRKEEGGQVPIPIVAVTAHAVQDELELCYAVGMDGHLVKPYEQEELAAIIERWLPEQASEPTTA